MFQDIIKINPIQVITVIPNIHNSYKKRWSLGVGLRSGEFGCRVDDGVLRIGGV
jgi:hypothetical protein